jgi:hypothetical protein
LEDNFFQNVHLITFSRNSLPALLRRAHFQVNTVLNLQTLFVVASKPLGDAATAPQSPLPFSQQLIDHPEEDARWLKSQLSNYTNLEQCALLLKHRGYSDDLFAGLIHCLQWSAFPEHLADVCAAFSEVLAQQGRYRELMMMLLAVVNGPFDPELRSQFKNFAESLMARVTDAA